MADEKGNLTAEDIGQPASASPAPPSQSPPPAAPAPSSSSSSWLDSFNEEHRAFVQGKGWDDPSKMVKSYQSMESFAGTPAERQLRLPRDPTSPEGQEAMKAIYRRLGAPETPETYFGEVPKELPVQDRETIGSFAKKAHELGLSLDQAKGLRSWFEERGAAVGQVGQEELDSRIRQDQEKLQREWGSAAQAKTTRAQQGRRLLGWDDATLDAIEAAVGRYTLFTTLATLGERLGEGQVLGAGTSTGFGEKTPGQARNELEGLKRDQEWVKAWAQGREREVRQFKELTAIIHSGETVR